MNLSKDLRLSSSELTSLKNTKPYQSEHSSLFTIKYFENTDTKFSFIVSKANVKKAVDRNLIRRRLKSVVTLLLNQGQVKSGFYLVIAKASLSAETNYEKINTEFNQLLSKIS